jgi:hypothetical protein
MNDFDTDDLQTWESDDGTEFEFSLNRLQAVRESMTEDYQKRLNDLEDLMESTTNGVQKETLMDDYKAIVSEWHLIEEDGNFVTNLWESKYADGYYQFPEVLIVVRCNEDPEIFTTLNEDWIDVPTDGC